MTMKSPTKQDFIEEMKFQRKLKVKISDPYATESSSDDEQEKRPKLIIHEIFQEKVNIQSFSVENKNPLNFDQISGKLPPMVRKRKSGKFATEIKDPFTKKRIWLGTFDTAEEASQVYQSKKLEFEERLAKSARVKEGVSAKLGSCSSELPLMVDSRTSDSSKVKTRFPLKKRKSLSFDQFSGKLPPMVRKRKSGKFATEIKDPFTKKRIWLGTFNTAEEASHVYQSKKLEFEKLKKDQNAKAEKSISAKSELGPSSSAPPLMVDSQDKDSSNEFDELLKQPKNAKWERMSVSAKSEIELCSSDPSLMVHSQNLDSSNEFDDLLEKAKSANVKNAISATSELGSSSSSDPPLMVDSQTSDSSNGVEEKDGLKSEEELWMGHWVQISEDKEVKFSMKLGVPVVDNYGFLLGEFSKLDDLSISA